VPNGKCCKFVTLNDFGNPGQSVPEYSRWWNGLELWAVISLSS
jgi:hypothetical protein